MVTPEERAAAACARHALVGFQPGDRVKWRGYGGVHHAHLDNGIVTHVGTTTTFIFVRWPGDPADVAGVPYLGRDLELIS